MAGSVAIESIFCSKSHGAGGAGEGLGHSMFPEVDLEIFGPLENLLTGGALVSCPFQITQVLFPPVARKLSNGPSLERTPIAGIFLSILSPPFPSKLLATTFNMFNDFNSGVCYSLAFPALVLSSIRS